MVSFCSLLINVLEGRPALPTGQMGWISLCGGEESLTRRLSGGESDSAVRSRITRALPRSISVAGRKDKLSRKKSSVRVDATKLDTAQVSCPCNVEPSTKVWNSINPIAVTQKRIEVRFARIYPWKQLRRRKGTLNSSPPRLAILRLQLVLLITYIRMGHNTLLTDRSDQAMKLTHRAYAN